MSEEKNIEGSSSQSPGNKPQAASDKLAVKEEQKSIGNKQLANESPIEESELSTEISNQKSGISKSEIENMEVHKHPHHVTHKKRWGEYFLEFLMIFLAVFLGFLAENFREDIADRKKEKQFMASLIRDLKIDVNRTNMGTFLSYVFHLQHRMVHLNN